MKRKIRKLLIVLLAAAVLCAAFIFIPNLLVVNTAKNSIITPEKAAECTAADCIVVLGAGVRNGKPTSMLRDRLLTGISLYENGAAPKIIMSGDHGTADYDEVNVMKSFAVERGVPDEDIFMDHAGFSTYESMYRGRDIFLVKDVIIVSQGFHLPRAVYIARKLGLDAVGYEAKEITPFSKETHISWHLREALARVKSFFLVATNAQPTYLGDVLPITGDGRSSWD